MMKFKTGDLVHVPSEVVLFTRHRNTEDVKEYVKLKAPQQLLVTRVYARTCEVFFENRHWLVSKEEGYEEV